MKSIKESTIGNMQTSQRAVLLSSYGTGANTGKNLGVPGYSHDIVMQLYAPILESWGKVIPVADPENNLEQAISDARDNGLEPVHLSVIPCQDAYVSENAPNILMPAWEFPDIPDHAFGLNPHNDWTIVASQCAALIVSGPFTSNAFRKSGVTVPIHHVQVPCSESYFDLQNWDRGQKTMIECSGYSFRCEDTETETIPMPVTPKRRKPKRGLRKAGQALERKVRGGLRGLVNEQLYRNISDRFKRRKAVNVLPEKFRTERLELDGVVYTSIFNPNDGRKNWQDLLTSFLTALGDKPDATLVVKLVTRDPVAVANFLKFYRGRDIKHQCRLVVTADYLTNEQLVDLTAASTYYIQTTRAEGNCLPLMDFLSAGRPGVSPCHSAISDYFDSEVGFVAESNPEPAAWPHDPQLRTRSTWGRLVWTSMVDQIRESYRVATESPDQYQQLAHNAKQRLRDWAGSENVARRLTQALDSVHSPHETTATYRRAA